MVACMMEVRDFVRGIDEHVNTFGQVLGKIVHELD
jgi:hypothetical protein